MRLLFLVPFAPRLDATHGGARVIAQLLAGLAARHRIALLYLRADDEPPVDDILRERCELIEEIVRINTGRSFAQRWPRYARKAVSLLRGNPIWAADLAVAAYAARVRALARTWRPDVVQIEYQVMGQYLSALDECPAPRVLTAHEPGTAAARGLRRSQQGLARFKHYLDMLAWKRFERMVLEQVQSVVVFTERDRQALMQLTYRTPVLRIPFGTVLPEQPLDPLGSSPLSLLFVGSFIHPPNIDAAIRLSSVIFPQVRERFPEAVLYIVGDQPPLRLRQSAGENVVITGCVPDVTPYLDRAALVVAPLRLGGGMRVKVVESLAAGKAVVASPLAIEGLNLVNKEQVIVAESDQQFCDAIVGLLADAESRAALAERARAWACDNLSWAKSIAAYEKLYEGLVPLNHKP